jgi:hypothetical protein
VTGGIDRLRAESSDGVWRAWRRFSLDGVTDQAGENERKFRAVLELLRDAGLLYTVRPRRGRRGAVCAVVDVVEITEGRSPV